VREKLEDFFIVVVSGSRDWEPMDLIRSELDKIHAEHDKVIIISGGASGVDHSTRVVCEHKGYFFVEIPAPWFAFGAKAGPIRNGWELVFEPNLVLAFHPNIKKSKGTKDMVSKAKKKKILVRMITG
jgi:hypothetical protein